MNSLGRFWLNLPIGYKGTAVILLPVACLAIMLAWIGVQLNLERAAEARVNQTQSVRLEAQRLLTAITAAETGVRGYDLTYQRSFLEPYHQARTVIPQSLTRLRTLVGKDAEQ